MDGQTHISNELSDSAAEGPVLQAGTVSGFVSLHSAKQVIHQGRSLTISTNLFRFSVSLLGCTAVYGAAEHMRPLAAAASLGDFLALPTGWTTVATHWFADRAEALSTLGVTLATLGILAMPHPRNLGGELGNIVKWRGPFTTVLGLTLVLQCGASLTDLITAGIVLAFGLWTVGRGPTPESRSQRAGIALVGIALAALYLPLLAYAWLFARDTEHRV
ncbi:hypothetical protein G3I40_33070 [Streptomyces sp. SID14478]|uniref:hypothetical protein n=1 Tax=Streptomyces sp. SID14478 TaxID=2706073 RepID=UPI0013D9B043|nr:hypothetical protein [Streptomyces sp. SID14478]NEB80013.1 hypothetical protein [Streptomyces sp. SID14478]